MAEARDILFESVLPTIRVEGEVRPELSRDLVSLEVEEDTGGLARLAFTVHAVGAQRGARDEALLYLDGRILDFGKGVAVSMGPTSAALPVFSGRISAIELRMIQGRAAEVTVRAEDALAALRMTRRFATYESASLEDIARSIAGRHGLTAEVDVRSPVQAMVQQWNHTDLGFLREQAARVGAEIWIEDRTLHVADRASRQAQGSPVTLIQGNDLLAVEVGADLAGQRTGQTVGGFDAGGKEGIAEEAAGDLAAAEADGRRTGPRILEEAFAAFPSFRTRDVPLTQAEARSWSRAALVVRARRFVSLRGITTGTPRLRVGSTVELQRTAPPFDGGGYSVTRAAHRFSLEQGYRTYFTAERPGLGAAA